MMKHYANPNYSRHLLWIPLILMTLAIGSCSKAYLSSQYDRAMRGSQKVAVLPYQVIFQGNPPSNMTLEMMEAQDARERLAFQNSFFRWLSSRWREYPVRLQNPSVSNGRLKEAGIDISRIEDYNPDALAEILGVDHLFSCVVVKHRYRSDMASIAMEIADILLEEKDFNVNNKTNDVKVTAHLITGSSGETLWSHTRTGEADWNRPVSEVMDGVHRRLLRQLPKK